MEKHCLNKWAEFGPLILRIREKYGACERELPDGRVYRRDNQILFRGHADSAWDLETTLERKTKERFDVLRYVSTATRCANEIESFTGKRWETKSFPELREEIAQVQDALRVHLPCYEYLVYLRQHGFPSPLLDWTESPYIAAFFAVCGQVSAERIAIYAYVETPLGYKSKKGELPMITVKGPYTTTHSRHFAQKAWYTIATGWSREHAKHYFCPHKTVFENADSSQDLLIAITIPSSERFAALRDLNEYNINHFTLFQSEDALVRAMAMKQFDLPMIQPIFMPAQTELLTIGGDGLHSGIDLSCNETMQDMMDDDDGLQS